MSAAFAAPAKSSAAVPVSSVRRMIEIRMIEPPVMKRFVERALPPLAELVVLALHESADVAVAGRHDAAAVHFLVLVGDREVDVLARVAHEAEVEVLVLEVR